MFTFSKRFRRNLAAFAALCLGLGLLFSWLVGGELCAPAPRVLAVPAGLAVEKISFPSASGSELHGWLLPPDASHGVVVLLHGVRGNREQMLARARFLAAAGYGALLFDFQAHGESAGKHITFGHLESRDAQAAVAFAKQRFPGRPVAVIGVSLGGAAALLAQPPLDVQALIVESAFPDIISATKDRLELVLGRPARVLSPLLTLQLKLRIGISADAIRPIDHVSAITTPKLFLHGSADPRTKLAEAQELFARAAAPKQFLAVPGADHEDLHGFLGARYEQLILGFLKEHLK